MSDAPEDRQLAFGGMDRLLTPAEVAAIFRVHPKTVGRWADAGKLASTRTLGGLRRFSEAEVRRLAATRGGNSS